MTEDEKAIDVGLKMFRCADRAARFAMLEQVESGELLLTSIALMAICVTGGEDIDMKTSAEACVQALKQFSAAPGLSDHIDRLTQMVISKQHSFENKKDMN